MKSVLSYLAVAFASATFPVGIAFAGESPPPPCEPVAKETRDEIDGKATKVLPVVSSKVAQYPDCACEIVKAAVVSVKASNALTGQIVEAAVRAAPSKYKIIVECAVAVNPDAAQEIRQALLDVFGSKGGKGGKVVVAPPPAPRMNPAVAMAYILDGITPASGYDLAMGRSALPGAIPFGSGSALSSALRSTGSIPGGNNPGVFETETPKTGGTDSGTGGGSTPSNPL